MNTNMTKFLRKNHITVDRALVGLAGLGLTITSGYCSVVGFNELFGNAGWIITALAICLECGKVAITGFLFTHWAIAKTIQKVYMTLALLVLMVLSGAGAFGFFQDAFNHSLIKYQNATVSSAGTASMLADADSRAKDAAATITEAQAEIQSLRKQVSDLPAEYAKSRTMAAARIAPEVSALNARITTAQAAKDAATAERVTLTHASTDATLAEQQAKLNAGPFMAIASKLGVSVDSLATVFISLLVLVFDPLAVSLIGAFAMTGKIAADEKKTKYAKIYRRRTKTASGKLVAPASETPATAKPERKRKALGRTLADITTATFTTV